MSAAGARAAATAATASLGRTAAIVRLPTPPVAAAITEELGLPSPEFQDIPLTPCVLRTRSDGSFEVLVSAPTLEKALAVTDADAAVLTLESAAFVQIGSRLLLLRHVDPHLVYGRAYLYRLLLRDAEAERRS